MTGFKNTKPDFSRLLGVLIRLASESPVVLVFVRHEAPARHPDQLPYVMKVMKWLQCSAEWGWTLA